MLLHTYYVNITQDEKSCWDYDDNVEAQLSR